MDDNKLDSVIHIDHAYAYACNETCIEEDPLKLPECEADMTEIKTENVEIKIEELDNYEEETKLLQFDPCDSVYYDLDAVHDNANIEFVNHTTFEATNCSALFSVGLEDSKSNSRTKANSPPTDKLLKENTKLKKIIETLRKEKLNCNTNIEKRSKKFYNDLGKMHNIQCSLQQEIKSLKEENEKYKTELLCYKKLKKHHFDLETQILELRRQAHRFMKYKKITLENIETVKTDVNSKSNKTKNLENRLAVTVKRLSHLKTKFTNLVNTNKIHSLKAAQCIELQNRLKSAVSMNKVYEAHLTSSKSDFAKKIKVKQEELAITKVEINSLRKLNEEKEATCVGLKEKFKFLLEQKNQDIEAHNEEVTLLRQQVMRVNNLLTQKHSDNIGLKKMIIKLEKELSDNKNKECDYCGL